MILAICVISMVAREKLIINLAGAAHRESLGRGVDKRTDRQVRGHGNGTWRED